MFPKGIKVRARPGKGKYAFDGPLPRRTWWQQLLGRPRRTFTVVSERRQPPRGQIGGTYTTIQDDDGKTYEIPACFLEVADWKNRPPWFLPSYRRWNEQ
ncbi:MAG: hypothetical protein ABIG32_02285 [Candidatus Uhrbacteria bacterium]|nr:hypothetical protein [Patescibacteria group bacterium]MBU1907004.1 hypothetical protein [Patescibacteria group bacterium]